jgi:HD superfamily phosphohydrolase
MRIRDPVHGVMPVSDEEKAVIDSPFFQRLRRVRQLGFGEMAFPGATHTRHAHSLGAMHVASRLFDAVASRAGLSQESCQRFRTAARLAVLCHDLGHMPLSHASERIAPPVATLKLPAWLNRTQGQASHEDYTAKVLLDSSLAQLIRERFARFGITPEAIAGLVAGLPPPGGFSFTDEAGQDWTPLLRALVSGELDADRMDYLLRDSFFTGVQYGRYDLEWIVQNLHPATTDGKVHLALGKAAAFAFEDFLLSRYHMFVSVYLHHTSVNFDHMLGAYYLESPGEFEIPSDPEAFLLCDDMELAHSLRRSKNRWAQRIVWRRGFKLLAQFTERDTGYDLNALGGALSAAGIEHFAVESHAALSKYAGDGGAPGLYIVDLSTGRLTEVAKYLPLFQRYAGSVRLSRAYVLPEQIDAAREVLAKLTR